MDMIPKNVAALVRIIQMALDRGLEVVLLRLPHHSTYRSSRRKVLDAEYDRAMQEVMRRVQGDKLQLWNYDRVDALTDSDFYDGDHLNGRGARVFTMLLKERL